MILLNIIINKVNLIMKSFYKLSVLFGLTFFISNSYAEQTEVMEKISNGVEYKCDTLWMIFFRKYQKK
jgi:hypothetical protein